MDQRIQRLLQIAREHGAAVSIIESTVEKGDAEGGVTRLSLEGSNLGDMVVESDKAVDFRQLFYNNLSVVTGQEYLLVHNYRLEPEKPGKDTQRFTVHVKYSPLEQKAGSHGAFEIVGKPKTEHHEFLVKHLETVKGITYSVRRVLQQPDKPA